MGSLVVVSFESETDTLEVLFFQELDESGSEGSVISPGSSAVSFVTQDGAVEWLLNEMTSFFGICLEMVPDISELLSSPGGTAQEAGPAEYISIIGTADNVFKFGCNAKISGERGER